MNDEKKDVVLSELNDYSDQGATLWLRGESFSPNQLAEIMCVRETHSLMRDYVFEGETLKEIHFDWVDSDRSKSGSKFNKKNRKKNNTSNKR